MINNHINTNTYYKYKQEKYCKGLFMKLVLYIGVVGVKKPCTGSEREGIRVEIWICQNRLCLSWRVSSDGVRREVIIQRKRKLTKPTYKLS